MKSLVILVSLLLAGCNLSLGSVALQSENCEKIVVTKADTGDVVVETKCKVPEKK